jgi:YD repeat-containing protein
VVDVVDREGAHIGGDSVRGNLALQPMPRSARPDEVWVEDRGEVDTVYNFEVEELHTYVAAGWRVHNDSITDLTDLSNASLVMETTGADGTTTRDIVTTLDGENVIAEYSVSGGQQTLKTVYILNGEPPTNATELAAALQQLDGSAASPDQLTNGAISRPILDSDGTSLGSVTYSSAVSEGGTGILATVRDANGNVTSQSVLANGTSTTTYYDSDGRTTSTTSVDREGNRTAVQYDPTGTQAWSTQTMVVDGAGTLLQSGAVFRDGSTTSTAYARNDIASTLTTTTSFADGSFRQVVTVADGNVSSSITTDYGSDGNVQSRSGTITDGQGSRSFVSTEPKDDGEFGRTTTTWNGGSTIVQTNGADGSSVLEVTATINGKSIVATYSIDADGGETLTGVSSLSGQSPSDADALRQALAETGVSASDLARMSDGSSALVGSDAAVLSAQRGTIGPLLSTFDVGSPTGIAPNPDVGAVPIPGTTLGGTFGTLTGVANLIRAIQSGNPLSIATSTATFVSQDPFGFETALLGSNSSLALDLSIGASGLQIVTGVQSLTEALNRGDTVRAITSGLGITNNAVSMARMIVGAQLTQATAAYAPLKGLVENYLLGGGKVPQETWDQYLAAKSYTEGLQDSATALGDISFGISAITNGINAVVAFEAGDIVNGIIDSVEAVASIVAIACPPAAPFIMAAMAVVSFIQTLAGGGLAPASHPVWIPIGAANLEPDNAEVCGFTSTGTTPVAAAWPRTFSTPTSASSTI